MDDQRRHLLVAGTGRAGTSALVRYLTSLGLETHLSRRGDAAEWDDAAQAGLEDLPLSAVTPDLPYVVKSPWSYQFVQDILDDPEIQLDGVIVPVRDLTEAAASRVTRQLQAVHQELPWMTECTTWEHWGVTPGGTVFSLNPVDEARLLAVGFHRLLERLVQADIPTVLLAFPRIATDPDYLHRKLVPILPIDVPKAQAHAVHATTFKLENIRVGRELGRGNEFSPVVNGVQGPTFQALDNAALKREVSRLRDQLSEVTAQRGMFARERDTLQGRLIGEISQLQGRLNEVETQYAARAQARDALHDQLVHEMNQLQDQMNEAEMQRVARAQAEAALRDPLETQAALITESEVSRVSLESERDFLSDQLYHEHGEKAVLAQEILALRASRSWRFTQPLRALGSALRAGLVRRPGARAISSKAETSTHAS